MGWVLGIALLPWMLAASVFALAGTPDPPRHKPRVKIESSIAEMSSRALCVRWPVTESLVRLTLIPTTDATQDESVLALAEFDAGSLGLFVGRQAPEDDRWILVNKQDLKATAECVQRSRER